MDNMNEDESKSWSVTPDKVDEVVRVVRRIAAPRRIIVFGSCAAGRVSEESDLDILVVEAGDVPNPRQESIRLRRALKHVLMAMDILVVSERQLLEFADKPGLIYKQILEKGRVVYDAAA